MGLSAATLPWVVSAYLLTFAGFLLVSGRVADLVGRRRVLIAGFAVFAAATIVDALAVNAPMLIAARAVQGIGAASSIPAALGILTSTFTAPAERSRAVAAFGAAGAVGFASGTNAGGAGWASPSTLIALAGGIVVLCAFLVVQQRVREPLMPPEIWRRPNLAAVMGVGFCLFAAWVGTNFFLSLTLQRVLGYSPTQTAIALLPLAIGGLIFATLAGGSCPAPAPAAAHRRAHRLRCGHRADGGPRCRFLVLAARLRRHRAGRCG